MIMQLFILYSKTVYTTKLKRNETYDSKTIIIFSPACAAAMQCHSVSRRTYPFKSTIPADSLMPGALPRCDITQTPTDDCVTTAAPPLSIQRHIWWCVCVCCALSVYCGTSLKKTRQQKSQQQQRGNWIIGHMIRCSTTTHHGWVSVD